MLEVVAGILGAALSRGVSVFSAATNLFGSVVAVTGDAHQAAVATDIFRADARHELSLLIREDMRDVHALMCETVSTQITMGSILFAICFGVLLEGYVGDEIKAAKWITELLMVNIAFAIVFIFLSLLLSLYFQTCIKNEARGRLLLKHRIFMPNDSVINRLGGYNLAEQVARGHAQAVGQIVNAIYGDPKTGETQDPEKQEVETRRGESNSSCALQSASTHSIVAQSPRPEVQVGEPWEGREPWEHRRTLVSGPDEPDSPAEPDELNQDPFRARMLRARNGAFAWYDKLGKPLSHKIVDMPTFLTDGVLLQQPWVTEGGTMLKFNVHEEATVYIAGRPILLPTYADGSGSNGAQEISDIGTNEAAGKNAIAQALQRNAKINDWDSLPEAKGNCAHEYWPCFQKLEGFPILVDTHKEYLPLYKLVLKVPAEGGKVPVEIQFSKTYRIEALIVIVREGCVLTSEDEYPKEAFIQDLEVLKPHLVFASRYIQCGCTCLLLACVFMHAERVTPIRPWPECAEEVLTVNVAVLFGVLATWGLVPMGKVSREILFSDRGRGETLNVDAGQDGCVQNGDYVANENDSNASPMRVSSIVMRQPQRKATTSTTSSSPVTGRNRRMQERTMRWHYGLWLIFCVLYFGSYLLCMFNAIGDSLSFGEQGESTSAVPAGWSKWPSPLWPPLFEPARAVFAPSGGSGSLWVASQWQLVQLDMSAAVVGSVDAARPSGPPLRLQSSATATWKLQGLSLVGGKLVAAGDDGLLHVLDVAPEAGGIATQDIAWSLASGLAAGAAGTVGSALALPTELGTATAFAAAPELQLWGADTGTVTDGAGVLAIAAVDASGSVAVTLFEATGLGSASTNGTLQALPLPRLRPMAHRSAAASTPSMLPAMHLCASGACASGEAARLWAADAAGGLVALGLSSGSVAEAQAPWSLGRNHLVALTGNDTHLIALTAAHGAASRAQVWSAPYAELLPAPSSSEL